VYQGYYFNLARNKTRLAALTEHLQRVGALERYQRFDAVDGRAIAGALDSKLPAGALGLWLSHEKLLQVDSRPPLHLHVIEDDAILAKNPVMPFDRLLRHADEKLEWDLIFTDVIVPVSWKVFSRFSEQMKVFEQSGNHVLLSLANIDFSATSSFFLNKTSAAKYAALISGGWASGMPLDIYMRQLVRKGQLKAYITLPFMTSISTQSVRSDIRGNMDRSRRVFDIFRQGFFQEADREALLAEMRALTQGARVNSLRALFLQAKMFSWSDQWEQF
jgi:hypothetical protein